MKDNADVLLREILLDLLEQFDAITKLWHVLYTPTL